VCFWPPCRLNNARLTHGNAGQQLKRISHLVFAAFVLPPASQNSTVPVVISVLAGLPALLFFAVMGILAMARPNSIPKMFGVTENTADSRTEVRSVYGGFGLAMAVAMIWAFRTSPAQADGMLLALAIAWLGWATGRLFSALLEKPKALYPTWAFVCIEYGMAALTLLARSQLA
jgi:Domain of unknown function (DUF4345)